MDEVGVFNLGFKRSSTGTPIVRQIGWWVERRINATFCCVEPGRTKPFTRSLAPFAAEGMAGSPFSADAKATNNNGP